MSTQYPSTLYDVRTSPQSPPFIAIHSKRTPETQICVHTIIDYVYRDCNFIITSIYLVGSSEITRYIAQDGHNSTHYPSTPYGVRRSPQSPPFIAIHSSRMPETQIVVHTIIDYVYRDSNFIIPSIYHVGSSPITLYLAQDGHNSIQYPSTTYGVRTSPEGRHLLQGGQKEFPKLKF